MGNFAHKIKAVFVAAVILATAACSTQFRNHGYSPSEADLANVIVGKDSRATVAELVGRPSAEGLLDGGGLVLFGKPVPAFCLSRAQGN